VPLPGKRQRTGAGDGDRGTRLVASYHTTRLPDLRRHGNRGLTQVEEIALLCISGEDWICTLTSTESCLVFGALPC
jgi:hypothetical protein